MKFWNLYIDVKGKREKFKNETQLRDLEIEKLVKLNILKKKGNENNYVPTNID